MLDRFDYSQIPDHMWPGLRAYVEEHRLPGDFLRAVLENDLSGACSRADATNLELLPVYAAFLHSHVPENCHGSPEKVRAWVAKAEDEWAKHPNNPNKEVAP